MGPTLARMAARAGEAGGAANRRIIAVSRFSSDAAEEALRAASVETIRCDLLDRDAVARLPDAPNVVFMAGRKFGTTGAPSMTWAMNTIVPVHCAERYRASRIVVFSTGNVYPLTPVTRGGSGEGDDPGPVGEYAMSCLGRERVFDHVSHAAGTPVVLLRLNYAIDLRYGVLTDLALKVWHEEPVPLAMGYVNVIWQGDANRIALECLAHAASPPLVLNVTGGETLSIRDLAQRLGERLGRAPRFAGEERDDALLSNTERLRSIFSPPSMALDEMLDLVAGWTRQGQRTLGKPTHVEARDGQF